MTLKACKECGKEISSGAKVCPHCGKKSPAGGLTLPVKIILALIGLGVVGNLIQTGGGPGTSSGIKSKVNDTPKSPREDKKANEDIDRKNKKIKAAKSIWKTINGDLRREGLVKDWKVEHSEMTLFVDKYAWRNLPFEAKKGFLHELSECSEELHKTPWVKVRDYQSGKIYAEVSPPFTSEVYE